MQPEFQVVYRFKVHLIPLPASPPWNQLWHRLRANQLEAAVWDKNPAPSCAKGLGLRVERPARVAVRADKKELESQLHSFLGKIESEIVSVK
jgi:hypothetical protein